jgi:hypothetical protein
MLRYEQLRSREALELSGGKKLHDKIASQQMKASVTDLIHQQFVHPAGTFTLLPVR